MLAFLQSEDANKPQTGHSQVWLDGSWSSLLPRRPRGCGDFRRCIAGNVFANRSFSFGVSAPDTTLPFLRVQVKLGRMHASFRAILLLAAVALWGERTVKAQGNVAPTEDTPPQDKSRPPHPEPRVIVSVTDVRGPHNPAKIQHAARFGWSRIVSCYKSKGPRERLVVALELVVSADGSVASARSLSTEPKYRDLTTCLAARLEGLSMPKASASSTANVEIQLAPGDPPPKSQ